MDILDCYNDDYNFNMIIMEDEEYYINDDDCNFNMIIMEVDCYENI